MDSLTPDQRSERMGRVRNKDTKPEKRVRSLIFSLGYRYRLHDGKLPGKPDLVFPGRRKVVFVHGCFWHRHGEHCALTRWPKSKLEFWQPKLEANAVRDRDNLRKLGEMGWEVLVLWECELRNEAELTRRVRAFLGETR